VELFLRPRAQPGGVLEEQVVIVAQIEDTSQVQLFNGILRANHSEVLIQNRRAGAANQIVTNGFVNHLAITRQCISPNILMVPVLMTSTATKELHFLYPCPDPFSLHPIAKSREETATHDDQGTEVRLSIQVE
jgi:hypothetical protein